MTSAAATSGCAAEKCAVPAMRVRIKCPPFSPGPPCLQSHPPAHACAPRSKRNVRCRWSARSTPIPHCSPRIAASARSISPAQGSRMPRSACRTWASPRSTMSARMCAGSPGTCELPLLVDADTGWGAAFNVARTCKDLLKAGAAGMHLEDQVAAKRCGHRPGKALVSAAGDERSHSRRGRCTHRSQLRRHGAHRCARRRRPAGRGGSRPGLRGGRRRHDLRRSAHHAR